MSNIELNTKSDLLKKLRAYSTTPDDDTIRLKNKIYEMLLSCPELLYALHDLELEQELFNDDGTINYTGEWDLYFGKEGHIRPFLFIPETQTDVRHYVCYQVSFEEFPRMPRGTRSLSSKNDSEKCLVITFNIFVHGNDSIDDLTGIARHDLIGSIIREKMAWSGITMSDAVPIVETESVTDTKYIAKTLQYQAFMPNNLVTTDLNGFTRFTNKDKP